MSAPAHSTKHIHNLIYEFNSRFTFNLVQLQNGISNGTALWLGGQVLACYLATLYQDAKHPPQRAIELGAGIGLARHVDLTEFVLGH
jgi:protein N-lysine methyltransferase METTL21D